MNEHLSWAAAMLGIRIVTKSQETFSLPSGNCTGKWDRTYMKEQNSLRSFQEESNKCSQLITTGAFVFKFQMLTISLFL